MPPRTRQLPRRRLRPGRPAVAGPVGEYVTDIDPLWPVARLVALHRDRYTCCRCGQPGGDVHHRVALQAGGALNNPARHDPPRLVTLCRDCHGWVHGHPAAANGAGFVLFAGEDPAATPVHMHHGTALLTQDGRMNTLTVRYR
jgi:hypothetical protein